ncbi:hypothetical protein [Pseudomonas sp. UBA6310]|uniref:hypothetical protein n=1 Tax=Pseudomonas sp. UBA6310 TaxID=1947327 RepID=UPI00257E7B62|nr:hypothetical protein [Pseudomonas sp. UBA6310]
MKRNTTRVEFEKIASKLMALSKELESLEAEVSLEMDKKALAEIITNLHWAAENSTVIGLHQIGEALEDNMGTGVPN